MKPQDFANMIRQKYPNGVASDGKKYSEIDDNELTRRIVEKYPVYKAQVKVEGDGMFGSPIGAVKDLGAGVVDTLKERGGNIIKEAISPLTPKEQQFGPDMTRRSLRVAGQAAGAIGDLEFEAIKFLAPKFVEDIASAGAEKLGNTEIVQKFSEKYSEIKAKHPEAMRDLEDVLNLAAVIPELKAAGVALKGGKGAAKTVSKITGEFIDANRAARIASATDEIDSVVGHVVQGKTGDILTAKKALSSIDTTGVKTYAELKERIDDGIEALANKVDDVLEKQSGGSSADSLLQGGKKGNIGNVQTDIITDKPIKIFRAEDSNSGVSAVANGKYFAETREFAKNYGDVIAEDTIPSGARILNFDTVKNNTKQKIISQDIINDPEKLGKWAKDNGYDYIKNTNTKGVEYVQVNTKIGGWEYDSGGAIPGEPLAWNGKYGVIDKLDEAGEATGKFELMDVDGSSKGVFNSVQEAVDSVKVNNGITGSASLNKGKLATVYHGTSKGTLDKYKGKLKNSAWFTTDKKLAEKYAAINGADPIVLEGKMDLNDFVKIKTDAKVYEPSEMAIKEAIKAEKKGFYIDGGQGIKIMPFKSSEQFIPKSKINNLKVDQLATVTKVGNKTIKQNFVKDALNQLDEMYKSIKDAPKRAEIMNLKDKLKTDGLTLKEINDLSRTYGREFGSKAFSKMGDPLTSVNAQAFENTRKGIKKLVREKMPDDMTKMLDRRMSEMIRTNRLVAKMEEKANALFQKAKKRGVLEKVAAKTATAIDTASFHTLSGFLSRMLPSNVGLKVMNSIDLEEALSKNLKKLDKLLKITNDKTLTDEISKVIQKTE